VWNSFVEHHKIAVCLISLHELRITLIVKNGYYILHIFNTLKYITSWVWWCMPVVPGTWEAEVGTLLETVGSLRPAWAI
jgi:hypothetical protein